MLKLPLYVCPQKKVESEKLKSRKIQGTLQMIISNVYFPNQLTVMMFMFCMVQN